MDCLFCGKDCQPTREHVIARWLQDVLGTGPGRVRRTTTTTERHVDGTFDGPLFAQTVKEVCASCNNGWSHDLEEAVRPVLTELLGDPSEPVQLSALQQERLALWAQKAGLLLSRSAPGQEEMTEEATFRWLGQHQMPLPGSIVWIGRREPAQPDWASMSHLYAFDQMRDGVKLGEGFSFALAVGQVLFLVYQQSLEPAAARATSAQRLQVIWPCTGDATVWPPAGPPFQDEELNELARIQPEGVEKIIPPQLADPTLLRAG